MSGIGVFYFQGSLVVVSGAAAMDAAVARMAVALTSGEASGIAIRVADGAAPVVSTWNDADSIVEAGQGMVRADWNAATRDTLAGILETHSLE